MRSTDDPSDSSPPEAVDDELAHLRDELLEESDLAADDMEALLQQTHHRIERETGVQSWLRSRPTSMRIALAIATVVGLTVTAGVARTPKPLDVNVVVHLAVLASLASWALALGLRPLQSRPLSSRTIYGTLGLLLLAPIALAFDGDVPAAEAPFWSGVAKCFVVGSVVAIPLVLLASSLSRGGDARLTLALTAAAGLGGNLWLETGCEVPGTAHILGGHVTIIVAYGALGALLAWLGFRRRQADSVAS